MSKTHLPHISEEVLEQYAMGRLSEPEIDAAEEHLLICTECQDSLTATEEFLAAVRVAAHEIQSVPVPEPWWRKLFAIPRPVMAAAACALLAVAIFVPRNTPTATVDLEAMRGPETAIEAPANSILNLRLSLAGLQQTGPLRAKVADSTGYIVLDTPVEVSGSQALATTSKLSRGAYWVRLYSGDEMIREYALNVQ